VCSGDSEDSGSVGSDPGVGRDLKTGASSGGEHRGQE